MLRCAVRRKEIADTPEERVRQKLVAFLERACGVPLRAISVEVDLKALGLDATGRADLVVWKAGSGDVKRPGLLAECKAPGELVEAEVEGQVARRRVAQVGVEELHRVRPHVDRELRLDPEHLAVAHRHHVGKFGRGDQPVDEFGAFVGRSVAQKGAHFVGRGQPTREFQPRAPQKSRVRSRAHRFEFRVAPAVAEDRVERGVAGAAHGEYGERRQYRRRLTP